jgi:hypothetical protein
MTTPTTFPGMTVKIKTEIQKISYLNTNRNISYSQNIKPVSNYEYEVLEEEKKRKIIILKPEYLSVFISDMKNIMKYDESSQYVNQNTKRGYNPKITGV